ncbi:hypothetical protein N7492_003809 [Penicillium capsulatum]|uniref:RlpA-like protein double-psi beta-barrel domain-containing protein n=1 Tax=Penicillium capsulatum TaxID=69766 RepID=A0A9W9IKA4_9EURO|nr:hypothetical protein N7492_003809 [Penicillium capsulatum]KAJ6121607.1 hypothetical protein N7512_004072 [Penicillium capsulatum]
MASSAAPPPPYASKNAPGWAAMPQRKPVATTTSKPEAAQFPLTTWAWSRLSSRSRRYLLIGLVAALLALTIGLAVGLTVGKKPKHANLALPTSHGGPYHGDLTYYNPALGACGYTNSDSDRICAVSHILFDAASSGSNPNANSLCGMKLRLRRNGRSVDVTVVDRCVGCAETDLDVTEAVFQEIAHLDQGRVVMEWAWLEKSPVK